MTDEIADNANIRTGREEWDLALLEPHRRWLMAYIRSQTGGREAAEDVTQEVFLVAIRKRDQYDSRYELGAWLRGIARNAIREYWRKAGRTPVFATEDAIRELDARSGDLETEPCDPDAEEQRLAALEKCLSRLTERARRIVKLKYLANLRSAAIGAQLQMKCTAVNMALARARIQLERCVKWQMRNSAE